MGRGREISDGSSGLTRTSTSKVSQKQEIKGLQLKLGESGRIAAADRYGASSAGFLWMSPAENKLGKIRELLTELQCSGRSERYK